MDKKKLQLYFFLVLLGTIGALCFWMILPYLGVLVLSATIAIALQPIYNRIENVVMGHKRVAAFLTIGVAVVIFLVPLIFFGYQILQESLNLYANLSDNSDAYSRFFGSLSGTIQEYLPGFRFEFSNYASQVLNWIVNNLSAIFSGTIQTLFSLFLGFIALYYFLVDGKKFLATFIELSPLSDDYDQRIIDRLEKAVGSVMKGSLLVAVVQGIISGLGFWMFGVPDPTIWGSCAALAALIPGVGTSLVLIPAVAYLAATGHYYAALGQFIWGATAVGLIDNLIGPALIGRGVRIHPFFVLISVLGGIGLFGPLGFIFGPLVLSLLYGLLEIYRMLILNQSEARRLKRILTKEPKKS